MAKSHICQPNWNRTQISDEHGDVSRNRTQFTKWKGSKEVIRTHITQHGWNKQEADLAYHDNAKQCDMTKATLA